MVKFAKMPAAAAIVLIACSTAARDDGRPIGAPATGVLAEPGGTREHIEALRARFRVTGGRTGSASVLPPGTAARFEASGTDAATHVHSIVASAAHQISARGVTVALPHRASGTVKLDDEVSQVGVAFALEGTSDAKLEGAGGLALYADAYAGVADIVYHVHDGGIEDFVFFADRPVREVLSYTVDVSRVAGLRLVSNTLEFLDESGAPRLRVDPPYAIDRHGEVRAVTIDVDGCSVDTNAAAPWGRRVTRPGSASCVLRLTWSGLAYPAVVDPSWTATTGVTGMLAAGRDYPSTTLLGNGMVLIAGGETASQTSPPTTYASAVLYDPATKTFAATGTMSVARQRHRATCLKSDLVLVTGGYNEVSISLQSAELYDVVTGAFTTIANMSMRRRAHTSTLLPSGRVLVAGGDSGGLHPTATTEYYDPLAGPMGGFTAGPSMNVARVVHNAVLLDTNKVLIAAGLTTGGATGTAEIFDPAANGGAGAFTTTGSLATPRDSAVTVALDAGKAIVTGGESVSTILGTTEVFDSAANGGVGAFTAGPPLTVPRIFHAATRLPSGPVLIAGGVGTGGATATTELYDPATGTIAAASPMTAARANFGSVLLATGDLLAVGGTAGGTSLKSAELYGCATACPVAPLSSCGAAGSTCADNGVCRPHYAAGTACGPSVCVGTMTTASVCDGGGTCSAAPTGFDCAPFGCAAGVCRTACVSPTDCAPSARCNAGTCENKLATGAPCSSAEACSSGSCADGYCCDSACTGQCESCDVVKGSCTATTGAPHGSRSPCAADPKSACSAPACNGADRNKCTESAGSSGPCDASADGPASPEPNETEAPVNDGCSIARSSRSTPPFVLAGLVLANLVRRRKSRVSSATD